MVRKCILNIKKCAALCIAQNGTNFEHIMEIAILIVISKWTIIVDFIIIANEMSDYGDNKSSMKLSLIKNYKSKIAHRKKPVCLGGPCSNNISLFFVIMV